METDPEYVKAFERATVEAGDAVEDKMHDFCFEGSVTAGIFLLKGLKPEKYKERSSTELTGKDGGPLTFASLDKMRSDAEQ